MDLFDLIKQANDIGYRVVPRDSCEDYETPGPRGQALAGKTCTDRKIIWISLMRNGLIYRSEHEVCCILSHELEHAQGKMKATDYPEYGLYCGGVWR